MISSSYDAVIVGGGPAGLNAALYLGRSCRSVALIDSGDARNMAAGVMHNHLTNDGVSIADFRARARAELAPYDVTIIDDLVTSITPDEPRLAVQTERSGLFTARAVLYAAGVRTVLPDVAGLASLWGQRAFECPYCHAWEVRGGRLAVYGGTVPSECLAATLTQWAPSISYLSDGRELPEEEQQHLTAAGIPTVSDRVAKVLEHADGISVEFDSGEQQVYRAMFMHTDVEPRLEPLRPWLDVADLWSLQTDERGRTSIPGLYVAGDLGKNMQQVVMAASSGGLAAMGINADLIRKDRPNSL